MIHGIAHDDSRRRRVVGAGDHHGRFVQRGEEQMGERLHRARLDPAGGHLALFDDAAWEASSPGGYSGTLGQGVEALWYDTWAHHDDIAAALGRPTRRGPGLRAGVHHIADVLTQHGWGPATLSLAGLEQVPVSGGGPAIAADPLAFVLVASGRADPASLGLDETVNIYR